VGWWGGGLPDCVNKGESVCHHPSAADDDDDDDDESVFI